MLPNFLNQVKKQFAGDLCTDLASRVLPYWHTTLTPAIKSGKKVFVAAHGSRMCALVKYLDNISDAEVPELNIPTSVPLVYELNENLKPVKSYYLGHVEEIARKAAAVANQGKAK